MTAPAVGPYLDPSASVLLQRSPAPRPALFLDRDGVINVDHGYVHAPEQVSWIQGIFELCQQAHAVGYLPVVVTNQAGIARGHYTQAQFMELTAWIHDHFRQQQAPLLATYYCPHHPTAGHGDLTGPCHCRKPAPGMLLAAAQDLALDLSRSLLVGDKESDIRAATAAGVGKTWLICAQTASAGLPAFSSMLAR